MQAQKKTKKKVSEAKRKPMASNASKKNSAKPVDKIGKVMEEFKSKTLHSRSKKGPIVSNPKQAIAIAISEKRKAGGNVKPKRKRK